MEYLSFEHARHFPQINKLGKQDAFRLLQTAPETFQWWRFAANLGHHTQSVVGAGLINTNLIERNDAHVILRFQRHDNSTVNVELVDVMGKGVKTLVHR